MRKRKQNYERFIRENPEAIPEDFSVDVTRDWLPSTARRDALLDQIRATVPLLTVLQKQVLGMLSQGQTMQEIALELKVTKQTVFDIVEGIRKKVVTNVPDQPLLEGDI